MLCELPGTVSSFKREIHGLGKTDGRFFERPSAVAQRIGGGGKYTFLLSAQVHPLLHFCLPSVHSVLSEIKACSVKYFNIVETHQIKVHLMREIPR